MRKWPRGKIKGILKERWREERPGYRPARLRFASDNVASMSDRVEKTNRPWTPRQLLAAGALLCAGVLAMWSAWHDWFTLSTQIEEHSHVFLVVPFGAIIMYINRDRFAQIRQTGPSWVGPLLVAGGFALSW